MVLDPTMEKADDDNAGVLAETFAEAFAEPKVNPLSAEAGGFAVLALNVKAKLFAGVEALEAVPKVKLTGGFAF